MFLNFIYPSQLPKIIHIRPLPISVSCTIALILKHLSVKKKRLIPLRLSELTRVNIGTLSSLLSKFWHTSPSKTFQDSRKHYHVTLYLSSSRRLFIVKKCNSLVEGMYDATLLYVSQTFRSNNMPDPRLDQDIKTCTLLQEQLRGYKNQDSLKRKQKVLPLLLSRFIQERASTYLKIAISLLLIGTIFFAMRSYEYPRTSYEDESKRTSKFRIRNFILIKDDKVLPYKVKDTPYS